MKILALGHRQQTGKDTLANFMVTRIRLNNRRLNVQAAGFADELKDTCYRLYSWAGVKRKEHYEINPKERTVVLPLLGITVRQLWINVGNHMRQYDPNVWVKALLTRPGVDVMIIKDLRFPNEVQNVKEHGGNIVKVTRQGSPIVTDGADDPLASYEEWDLTLDNDGTMEELSRKADMLVDTFLKFN